MTRTADQFELLKHCIPNDHSKQVSAEYYVNKLVGQAEPGVRVLDLGCGTGRSYEMFRHYDDDVEWTGVDIEDSPEVANRTREDLKFLSYDGVNLPLEDASVDVVYSSQVFEHVRYPEKLLPEVLRVLVPGGGFIGSVSSLEPYHSLSLWSFTPYGWHELLATAGFTMKELRPGIDAISLIRRSYLGRPREAGQWFKSSPLNEEIEAWGKSTGRRAALVNNRKLQYCGHLVFWASRPDS